MTLVGFPHSGISGSTPACGSPKLIAANHALLRLSTPRHPPCALSSLTIKPVAACRGPTIRSDRCVVVALGLGHVRKVRSLALGRRRLALGPARRPSDVLSAYRVQARVRLESLSPVFWSFFATKTLLTFRPTSLPQRGARSYVRLRSSIRLSEMKQKNNGGNGTRTRDPRLAKPMLYQLSYSPA